MTLTNFNKLLAATFCLATSYSYADSDRPLFSMTMTESGVSKTNSDGSLSQATKSESRMLPIWGDEARARGYDLPQPFGVSYGYMNLRQNISIDDIGFSSQMLEEYQRNIGGDPTDKTLKDMFVIKTGNTRQSSESHMLKLDSWVFPFLNVYGVYGKTRGTSKTMLNSVRMHDTEPGDDGFDPEGSELLSGGSVPFDLDFEGKTYGGGFTLAGGYKDFFAVVDTNFTRTKLDILDGELKAAIVSPRLGYNFVFNPLINGQGNTKLQVWAGAMYQKITQRLQGNVSNLNLPPELAAALMYHDMKFDVKQHLAHRWNYTTGARIELTRNFAVITEIGFGEHRSSTFVSGEFRF
ncbi:MAG: hypothetical protein LBI71_04885 [Enterobacteriaceae bacterium]|nr:hypothetical protein [Enterobacteriaceae bacterium]